MKKKLLLLKLAYRTPIVMGIIRSVLTLAILIWNPFGMPYRFVQLIPMFAFLVYTYLYSKVFSDSVPVIPILLPTIVQFIAVWVINKEPNIAAFLPVIAYDILYIVVRSVKATMFPFVIESDEDDSELL